ncbi:hypothetical protein CHS0354_042307 [Potamilus streckersoni]|uniref:Uncharacterized protein n=1 Tax=Potamilus streckersoni TaxID=2493646 RepID=A0AAE0W0W8_9BIVA|nr:hypothetical protein CHS0354_042307 [Potamilus streckersoni]
MTASKFQPGVVTNDVFVVLSHQYWPIYGNRVTDVHVVQKIWDLEERDREFIKILEKIDVLKEGLDEAQRQLANMKELEYRLQKAEQTIRTLEKFVDSSNAHYTVNESHASRVYDTN